MMCFVSSRQTELPQPHRQTHRQTETERYTHTQRVLDNCT